MTAQNNNEDLEEYFGAAGSWADDRLSAIRKSRKTAWFVASIAVLVALAEAMALLALAPLKTVVPYTLLVDRQTGYVQSLDPIAPQRIAPDAALTQSFLVQYVLAREGYDRGTVKSDYRKVSLWSAGAAQQDYVSSMQISNPASPLARFPRSTVIQSRVRSVSALSAGTALVRFETTRIEQGGVEQPSQSWVAVISYKYSNDPMAVEDRFTNPLGFQVTRYRKTAESLPSQSSDENAARRDGDEVQLTPKDRDVGQPGSIRPASVPGAASQAGRKTP